MAEGVGDQVRRGQPIIPEWFAEHDGHPKKREETPTEHYLFKGPGHAPYAKINVVWISCRCLKCGATLIYDNYEEKIDL